MSFIKGGAATSTPALLLFIFCEARVVLARANFIRFVLVEEHSF